MYELMYVDGSVLVPFCTVDPTKKEELKALVGRLLDKHETVVLAKLVKHVKETYAEVWLENVQEPPYGCVLRFGTAKQFDESEEDDPESSITIEQHDSAVIDWLNKE